MAQHSRGSAAATVTALRRPPVRQSVLVRSDRQHTFEVFVATIGTWWPVNPFSAGKDRVRDVTFERRPGGRVYETWHDGTEVDWGEVLVWEPPARFAMTWTSPDSGLAQIGPLIQVVRHVPEHALEA